MKDNIDDLFRNYNDFLDDVYASPISGCVQSLADWIYDYNTWDTENSFVSETDSLILMREATQEEIESGKCPYTEQVGDLENRYWMEA